MTDVLFRFRGKDAGAGRVTKSLAQNIRQAGANARFAAQQFREQQQSLRGVGDSADRASRAVQRFSRRELRAGITAGRAFNGVLTEITTSLIGIVSRTALLAGSAALGAFFVDGVRGALKFDEALTQVQALTNASREDIELYRDSVRQVASDVGRSLHGS